MTDKLDEYDKGLITYLTEDLGIDLEGKKVLEIGCSDASLAPLLVEGGVAEYYGCDSHPDAKKLALENKNVNEEHFLDCSFTKIPKEFNGKFDIIICTGTTDYMPPREKRSLAIDINRLSSPDATVLVSLPQKGGTDTMDKQGMMQRLKDMETMHDAMTASQELKELSDSIGMVEGRNGLQQAAKQAKQLEKRRDKMNRMINSGESVRSDMMGFFRKCFGDVEEAPNDFGDSFKRANENMVIASEPLEKVPNINEMRLSKASLSR